MTSRSVASSGIGRVVRVLGVLALVLMALGSIPGRAYASGTFSVTSCTWNSSPNTDFSSGLTSLTDAAGILSGTLYIACSGTITMPAGTPAINVNGALTVTNYGGSTPTLNGNGHQLFNVASSGSLTVSNLTVTGASSPGNGGAISSQGPVILSYDTFSGNSTTGTETNPAVPTGRGGAVYVTGAGSLNADHVTFSGNSAGSYGGAVEVDVNTNSTWSLANDNFSNNTAVLNGGALNANLAFISNTVAPIANLSNTTFSGNKVTSASNWGGAVGLGTNSPVSFLNDTLTNNSAAQGGAIMSYATIYVAYSTIAGNTEGPGGGQALYFPGGGFQAMSIIGTILNNSGNCSSPVGLTDYGYNLAYTGDTCGFTKTTDISGKDPLLQPLANNGGPAPTMALAAASPALNLAPGPCTDALHPGTDSLTTDERGFTRPVGLCDSGAYELQCPSTPSYASGFPDSSCLTINQAFVPGYTAPPNPAVAGNALTLTNTNGQDASAFYTNTINTAQGFTSQFNFSITPATGLADGMTFVLQSQGPQALGCNGGDLGVGYGGSCGVVSVTSPLAPSVAVEFDTLADSTGISSASGCGSTSGQHVAIVVNGDVSDATNPAACYSLSATSGSTATITSAWVDYDGQNLKVYLASPGTPKPASPTLTYPVSLQAALKSNSAYIGFTGATGSNSSIQSIQSWTLSTAPVTVSSPTSTISFPTNNSGNNEYAFTNACSGSPWNTSNSVCGWADDHGAAGINQVGVLIRDTGKLDSHVGLYWNGNSCTWQSSAFWNLANFPTGSSGGGSGIVTSAGGSGIITSAGGGTGCSMSGSAIVTGAGGSGIATAAGGSGIVTSAGGGPTSTAVPWVYPLSLPPAGTFQITTQAADIAGYFEANGCGVATTSCPTANFVVDTQPPTSTITFPASGDFNATTFSNGCNSTPWNATNSVCGWADDHGGSGIAAVGLLVQDTGSTDPNYNKYWDGVDCTWNTSPYWNLAAQSNGSGGGSAIVTGAGGSAVVTAAGGSGIVTSAGGSGIVTAAGGGNANASCKINGSAIVTGAGGSGIVTSAGGSGIVTAAGGGSTPSPTAVPWVYKLSLPTNGHYKFMSQAVDGANNFEGGGCASGSSCPTTATQVDTIRPTASILVGGQNVSGAQNINPASTIHITFSEPPMQSTLSNIQLAANGTPLSGVTATCADTTFCENVTITGVSLNSSTVYTLALDSGPAGCTTCITDLAGNSLDPGDNSTNNQVFTFTTSGAIPIAAHASGPPDDDGDGIPNIWDGTTFTSHGNTINTAAWGFSPTQKDICVVEDPMVGTAGGVTYDQTISQRANQDIVNSFWAQGINLVIFEGANTASHGGTVTDPGYSQPIPPQATIGQTNPDGSYDWKDFDKIRRDYFLPTGLAQICHFAVIAHSLGGTDSTGSSRGFKAGDFVIALGQAPASGTTPAGVGTEAQQAGTVMHELGHNLGLHHGGGDDVNFKPNYLSVMNYFYQFTWLTKSGAPLLDYSESALPTLTKSLLSEITTNGIGSAAAGYAMKHKCGNTSTVVANATGPIDWNCDATIESTSVGYDINAGGSTTGTLTGYNDWGNLNYVDGTIGFGGGTCTSNPDGSVSCTAPNSCYTDSDGVPQCPSAPQASTSTIDVSGSTSTTGGATESGGVDSIGNVAQPEQTAQILQAAPTLSWSNPASIVYGTPLSSTQLNATANVPGSFSYTPAAGAVLGAGTRTLTATFTPIDSADFASLQATVPLTVNRAGTTTTLATPANSTVGQTSVTLSASVTAVSPSAATVNEGTVTFQLTQNGTNAGSAVTVPVSNGTTGNTAYTLPSGALGKYTVNATYNPASTSPNFNGSTATTQTFSVLYAFSGYLQPVNDPGHPAACGSPCPMSVFKAGSTIPIKFQLSNSSGQAVQAGTAPIFSATQIACTVGSVNDTATTTSTSTGNTFTYNSGQYQYNWSTKNLASGTCWMVSAALDDGTTQTVNIGLR